jgi:cytochrome c-type biogenesis protein CcmE
VKKPFVLTAIALVAGALGWLAFGSIGENLVYYWTPTELVAAKEKAVGPTIRLGGVVEAGSVRKDGTVTNFRVTDGTNAVPVAASTIPPQMFRDGIGVVVEGTCDAGGQFTSRRIMVKHDETYRAPTGGGAPAAMFSSVKDGD